MDNINSKIFENLKELKPEVQNKEIKFISSKLKNSTKYFHNSEDKIITTFDSRPSLSLVFNQKEKNKATCH